MHKLFSILAFSFIISFPAYGGGGGGEFFDGKTLDSFEGLIADCWTVQDGAIIGASPKGLTFNTFLCSKKKYADFELAFQVKMPKGNSGVQIRSHIHDRKRFGVTGPQCDMGDGYWGSLNSENFGGPLKYADAKLVNKILKRNDFNDYAIKAVGKHVTIKLNGHTTVGGDFERMPADGIIAFQLHAGGPMEVIFRDIQFKELSK